jgi:serine/threonine-protein kinase RsbW
MTVPPGSGVACAQSYVNPRVSVNQRALPGAVPAIRAAVARFLDELGVATDVAADIKLAVTEACTNVVRHAYPDVVGDVRCEIELDSGHVVVRVCDWGRGHGAQSQNPGMGVGRLLMERLADGVERRRVGEMEVVELRFIVNR